MLAALTLLPALLAMLGPKVDALSVRPLPRRASRRGRHGDEHGVWYRIAHARHAPSGRRTRSSSSWSLLALALPFLRVQFGGIDDRALPAGTESRVVAETLDARLPGQHRRPRSTRS